MECDALTKEDWECLAYLGSRIAGSFSKVCGVPRGGIPFARAMEEYQSDDPSDSVLVVDDVLTTGGSICKEMRSFYNKGVRGLVVFARGSCPPGVEAIFYMNEDVEDAKRR
jgi:orotate phosphoribosyltransferase